MKKLIPLLLLFLCAPAWAAKHWIDLSWKYPLNDSSFNLYRATVPAGSLALLANTPNRSYRDYNIAIGQDYYYVVKAKRRSTGVESNPSNQAGAIVGTATFSATFTPGNIDTTKWVVSNSSAPGGGVFRSDHVDISAASLRLRVTQDTANSSIGGEVRSKLTYGYGTYVYVMRASSTAWGPVEVGSPTSGQVTGCFNFINNAQTEIDMPEIEGQTPLVLDFTNWIGRSQQQGSSIPVQSDPAGGFHTYRTVWQAASVRYFMDGVLLATHASAIPSMPAYIMANHWGTNSTDFGGLATVGVARYMYVKSVKYYPPQ